jgi:putative FmdB family regulatory protein
MPFYEYQCRHCGHQTEVLQKISAAPLRKCPACGRNGLSKLISAPVFRLKGGGWYETDFKGDKDRKRNLAGDEAAPAAKDDKPAAKPVEQSAEKSTDKSAEKSADKSAEKSAEKAPVKKGKTVAKPARKPARRAPAKAK